MSVEPCMYLLVFCCSVSVLHVRRRKLGSHWLVHLILAFWSSCDFIWTYCHLSQSLGQGSRNTVDFLCEYWLHELVSVNFQAMHNCKSLWSQVGNRQLEFSKCGPICFTEACLVNMITHGAWHFIFSGTHLWGVRQEDKLEWLLSFSF